MSKSSLHLRLTLATLALSCGGCGPEGLEGRQPPSLTQPLSCDPMSLSEALPRLARHERPIYGGWRPQALAPEARATLALFSRSDDQDSRALIDGSATLISPRVALGAAHTCDEFKPTFAAVGATPPDELQRSYEEQLEAAPAGRLALIERCVVHPEFQEGAARPNDIALFYLSHPPAGASPASLLDPHSDLPSLVSIVGFGAHEGQFDRWWEEVAPYELRRVDTHISARYEERGLFVDGPNPGLGSCQGDSGGPLFVRLTKVSDGEDAASTSSSRGATEPILVGSVVMGPECDKGLGYNTDLRQYIDWIETQPGVELQLAQWEDYKSDHLHEVTRCP